MKKNEKYVLKNTNEEIKALAPINEKTTVVPDTITMNVSGTKTPITLKRGEMPIAEMCVDFEVAEKDDASKQLNRELDKLRTYQASIMKSKLKSGLVLSRIKAKPKKGEPLYKAVASTFEEFCTLIHMNKKTAYLWVAVAEYASIDGKLLNCIENGMVTESAVFAAHALKWSPKTLDDICSTADHAITSAKDLFREYNRYIKSLPTDEEPSLVDEETGKPLTEEEAANAVEASAESLELDGVKYHLFSVHGKNVKKGTTVKVPEEAMINTSTLATWSLENAVQLAKVAKIDVSKDNNAVVANAVVTAAGIQLITIVQTVPEINVTTFMSCKTLPGNGIKEKTNAPETEPETTETTESV